MNSDLIDELEELRRYKRLNESNRLNKAFDRLELVLDAPYTLRSDTVMSVRAFKILAEALKALKDEVLKTE